MEFKNKDKNSQAGGFSLIEMLVVITVFSILAILATQSLATSLRGTRKSESIGHVRENIEFAMSMMERSLRTASELECPIPATPSRLDFKTSSFVDASFECTVNNIASSSGTAIIKNLIIDNDVKVVNCGTDTRFICNKGSGGNPDSVIIQIRAEDANSTGAESAIYTSETRILLRNY
jgi:prepilin-type N-terminal cleavage/methylation domain-containing protein